MKTKEYNKSAPGIMGPIPHCNGTKIIFDEANHTYINAETGLIYKSVSNVIGKYKNFDRKAISERTAEKRKASVESILKEWDEKRDRASNYGTRFHKAIELFDREGKILDSDQDIANLLKLTKNMLSGYKWQWCEQQFASDKYGVCGTADKPVKRFNQIMDIFDYKTNTEKGIEFSNNYNTFMKAPFNHLEDCNYNHYALQLSIYAYIAETEYNQKIGRLAIIDVSSGKIPIIVPVNYLRNEAELMLMMAA